MSDNDIPPPLMPEPPKVPREPDRIMIPFKLADAVRLQLEFLSRSTALAENHREQVREWLNGYNLHLANWLHEEYGPEAVLAADAMSRETARRMSANLSAAQEKAERDLFSKLEEEFRDDG